MNLAKKATYKSHSKPLRTPRDVLDRIDRLRELHALLLEIDRLRQRQHEYHQRLTSLLDSEMTLEECYMWFRANNGATMEDFERFLQVYCSPRLSVRCKLQIRSGGRKHLRVISDDGERTLFKGRARVPW
jgi:hypothetical protein